MASQQGKWREEQILILCPGSQTTMAQLGCNELTPPAYRIPTRMFKDEDEEDQWRPYATVKRKKAHPTGEAPKSDDDEWEYVEDPDSGEGAVFPIQGASMRGQTLLNDGLLMRQNTSSRGQGGIGSGARDEEANRFRRQQVAAS